ncbi:Tripartite ATP-independent periplasmic transporter DctQ component [Candidatus Propionivibrio aalborgensis]|uniref:TRAP transporter small permease protein n=1 Tax=Candidatus Propionivibrio aalborgensis TaxID=1860101 RepID=A0A1A8Y1V2_9RHOO|nr:TRAP transporter small permease subunit [Candidatus Propionivibrio aalborgensis]SBT11100.1 Tripartite ATP-independent periplasmic transporter DctQ component [Candidatus Propionivibrio aalborgensis]HRC60661.1 TRAP transporter small permease subunit [Candidatus Propionivibrio aalborgensis]
MTVRRALDRVYGAAAWMAALFMIGTLVMILLSIGGRLLNFHVRGTDAYAGYSMAAAAFLALAHTFKRGEHIRVTLLLDHAGRGGRHILELWSHVAGLLCAAVLAWFSVRLVWQSLQFNDISQGTDATPLWIPQLGMAIGSVIFTVAVAEELIATLRGGKLRVRTAADEAARSE